MKTGKVYKIIHSQSNICYVGSTFNTLRDRFRKHKDCLNNKRQCSIVEYFNKYGKDQFSIVLIKEYEVIDRKHLEAYEQLWINKLKPINKINPFRIKNLTINKYAKTYRKTEQYISYRKAYMQSSAYKESCKKYNLKHKDRYKEWVNQTIICECGKEIKKGRKSQHIKSKKHLNIVDK